MSTNWGKHRPAALTTPRRRAPSTASPAWLQLDYFNDTPCHRLTTTEGPSCCSGRPDRSGHRRPGLRVRRRVPGQRQYQPDDPRYRIRCCTRAERWPWPTRTRHQPASSSWCTRTRSRRRTSRCSAKSTDRSGHAGQDRRGRRGGGGQGTGKPQTDVQVKSIGLTDGGVTTPAAPPYGAPPPYGPYGYPRPRPTNGFAIRVVDLRLSVRAAGHHLRAHLAVADQAHQRRGTGWRWPAWSSATSSPWGPSLCCWRSCASRWSSRAASTRRSKTRPCTTRT
jgi:peptidyl-prolyl cis-trans isomerase B (cyclophilin B)